jgi:hypothetical protein
MDRRTFNKLAGFAAIGAIAETTELHAQSDNPSEPADASAASQVVLEGDELLVAFDKLTGALTRFERKSTHWVIQRRPELAISFRLLVPLPNRDDNFVHGRKQKAIKVEKVSDTRIEIEWKDLISDHGGVLPITLSATVDLQNGTLAFGATLTNNSSLTVQTVDYPYFGDLNSPSMNEALVTQHMWYGNLVGDEIYPHFSNEKGYWGVKYPMKMLQSNQSIFCLIQAAAQGLYVEMHDPTQPYLLEYTFVQHPGVISEIDNVVPKGQEISGKPVHMEFRTCHFVYVRPHSSRNLVSVVLRCYDGDWHAGVDVYKKWRETWFQEPHIASWALDVHSWQQLQIDGAEQDYSIPYRELPKYIDECAANGVRAIQLVGWNIGGQDGGDPCLDIDPGLGTWDELHQAIQYANRKGVKMIMFGKLYWADMTREWYKKEFYKYNTIDPYGIPYETGGYSYTTPTQLTGINNRRRTIMDVQDQDYRDAATHQFEKILALGAPGWLFDEVCHHAGVYYSFAPDHGYPPPDYIYGGDMPMARQFRAAADKSDPDFIFAGEGPQDWLMQYYPVSYFRINNGSRPVCRYIDSRAPLMVAVTGFDDREMLNLILLNRYIISYEPYNFKGQLTDFPLTLAYGKKIDALRSRYKDRIWNAEFRDTLGATVTADGAHKHSVFVSASGKRTVIVVNQELKGRITAKVEIPNPGKWVMATPEDPDSRATSGTMRIPARSAVVLMES